MELLFDEAAGDSNNKFHKGLNVTVRLGTKYSAAEIGSHVTFLNLQGENLGEGDLVAVFKLHFKNISKGVLEKEHDVQCRTLEGLRRVLETVYGRVVLDNDVVCVLIIRV